MVCAKPFEESPLALAIPTQAEGSEIVTPNVLWEGITMGCVELIKYFSK